jgi:hypothetical protein
MADQSGVPLLCGPMKAIIKFEHPMLGHRIEFTGQAWRLMNNCIQSWPWNKEAGGQMFGQTIGYSLIVEEASGRGRTEFRVNVPTPLRKRGGNGTEILTP